MHAIDEYDIRQAFDVLDAEKDDVISLNDLETILLGLGFCDRTDSLLLERQLCDAVEGVSDPSQIDVETVIKIIRLHVSLKESPVWTVICHKSSDLIDCQPTFLTLAFA